MPSGVAHSLFISRFIKPSVPPLDADARQLAPWKIALKESVEQATARFKQAGLIIPYSPSDAEELQRVMEDLYRIQQLKEMLKSRSLKLNGRKCDLVNRLIEADALTLSKQISALGLYSCSAEGLKLAAIFEERKQKAYLATEAALKARDFRHAGENYRLLESDLGFPKSEFELRPNQRLVELVMTVRPPILDGCSEAVISLLRLSMAIGCLSGRPGPKNLLQGLQTGVRLDAKTAAGMIYSLAKHIQDRETWKSIGIVRVTHFAVGESCAFCRSLDGREYQLNSAPELPRRECTHNLGCRCCYQPVLDF